MITFRSFIIWKIDILYYLAYFNPKVFQGNVDKNSIVHHDFAPFIVARFLRVHPKTWHNYISMRIEIYGCIWKGDPLLYCLLTSILPLYLAIVFRIKLSGIAVNFKEANNELGFLLIIPWKWTNLLFYRINIYTVRSSDWIQTLLLADCFNRISVESTMCSLSGKAHT